MKQQNSQVQTTIARIYAKLYEDKALEIVNSKHLTAFFITKGRLGASGNIEINEDKCIGCGKCVSACPHTALRVL